MAPRRSHKKSRAGCQKCKKRRIKCDEVHPHCGNCTKHAIICDFSLPPSPDQTVATVSPSPSASGGGGDATSPPVQLLPIIPQISTSPVLPPSELLPRISEVVPLHSTTSPSPAVTDLALATRHHHYDPFSFSQPHSHIPPPPVASVPTSSNALAIVSPTFNVVDLALIHQWTIETANTISNRPDLQLLWRVKIPELAVHQPYLMHAILGVSALHLHTKASSSSSSSSSISTAVPTDYLAVARTHHTRAVRGMAQQLASISQTNCHALVVSSCLVVIYSFVATRLRLDSTPPTIAAWMPLLRGVHSILKQAWTWVTDGPLSDLITQYKMATASAAANPTVDPSTDAAIARLFQLCTDRTLPDPHRELDDTKVSTAYFSVIAQLRQSYASMAPEYENLIAVIFIWPIVACDEYVELLVVKRRPRALVIFLHYCALFTLAEEFWWSRGNAGLECERIVKALELEEGGGGEGAGVWEEWTRWPRERIREACERRGKEVGAGENRGGDGMAGGMEERDRGECMDMDEGMRQQRERELIEMREMRELRELREMREREREIIMKAGQEAVD